MPGLIAVHVAIMLYGVDGITEIRRNTALVNGVKLSYLSTVGLKSVHVSKIGLQGGTALNILTYLNRWTIN